MIAYLEVNLASIISRALSFLRGSALIEVFNPIDAAVGATHFDLAGMPRNRTPEQKSILTITHWFRSISLSSCHFISCQKKNQHLSIWYLVPVTSLRKATDYCRAPASYILPSPCALVESTRELRIHGSLTSCLRRASTLFTIRCQQQPAGAGSAPHHKAINFTVLSNPIGMCRCSCTSLQDNRDDCN